MPLDREVADAGEERQVEQLGELGADLAGVGVDRVAARRARGRTGLRARARRPSALRGGQRVGAGERGVGHEHAVDVDVALESPRDRLAQRVLGRRRPERDERDRVITRRAVCASSTALLTARRQYGFISSSMPSRSQPPVGAELHLLELRDLLDQRRDAHLELTSGIRSLVSRSSGWGRSGRSSGLRTPGDDAHVAAIALITRARGGVDARLVAARERQGHVDVRFALDGHLREPGEVGCTGDTAGAQSSTT